jgi:hypothetical protein
LGVAATAGLAFGFAAAGFDLGFFSFVLLGSSSIPRKHMNFMKLLNAAMAVDQLSPSLLLRLELE